MEKNTLKPKLELYFSSMCGILQSFSDHINLNSLVEVNQAFIAWSFNNISVNLRVNLEEEIGKSGQSL